MPPAEDGRQETTVLRAAARAKQAGARVFTIGVGDAGGLNEPLLGACASGPGDYRHAPDAEELGRIYAQIAFEVACPGARLWGKR